MVLSGKENLIYSLFILCLSEIQNKGVKMMVRNLVEKGLLAIHFITQFIFRKYA